MPESKRDYYHKGKKLVPMTREDVLSLQERDVIKYIGPADFKIEALRTYPYNSYARWGRHPVTLYKEWSSKMVVKENSAGKLSVHSSYGWIKNFAPSKWAFAKKGAGIVLNEKVKRAERYVPQMLNTFKKQMNREAARLQKRIDHYLEALPIHKKLEFLAKMKSKDKQVFEFIYKDMEDVIKEADKDEG